MGKCTCNGGACRGTCLMVDAGEQGYNPRIYSASHTITYEAYSQSVYSAYK